MRRTSLRFDQLNSLSREEYEEYFEPMGITEDQKTDRVLVAMALEDRLLSVFSYIELLAEQEKPVLGKAMQLLEEAFLAVALLRVDDDNIRMTAQRFGSEVALSTFNHLDVEYFLSAERAVNIAKTESNLINDYGELADAVDLGYTAKRWNTIMDGRERDWHAEVDGAVVPIDEPFEVGGDLMMHPLDDSLGAGSDNIANCRCWLTFLK